VETVVVLVAVKLVEVLGGGVVTDATPRLAPAGG